MATITSLPTTPNSTRYTYADLHLDLKPSYTVHDQLWKDLEQKDLKRDFDIKAIRNSIVNLLTTSPGDKILNPRFGLDLRQFLFEPINRFSEQAFATKIVNHLRAYEPRVEVLEVVAKGDPENQTYVFDVYFRIPSLSTQVLYLNGTLNIEGYIFN